MIIYDKGGIRVVQHQFLQIFNVEIFREGEWVVEEQVNSIEGVNLLVNKLKLCTGVHKQEIV